ncbi:Hypothetical predicted protein [Marmota monax]|uniref:Uncharacterized protein n=1 Tax=Marmota monax TaxID=9995 RepID=A0A5E4CWP7_MARMO|nr:Hypothetical predicted protein [Marmota monax]
MPPAGHSGQSPVTVHRSCCCVFRTWPRFSVPLWGLRACHELGDLGACFPSWLEPCPGCPDNCRLCRMVIVTVLRHLLSGDPTSSRCDILQNCPGLKLLAPTEASSAARGRRAQ